MKNSNSTTTAKSNKSVENMLLVCLFIIGVFGMYFMFSGSEEDSSKELEEQIVQLSHYSPKEEIGEETLAFKK